MYKNFFIILILTSCFNLPKETSLPTNIEEIKNNVETLKPSETASQKKLEELRKNLKSSPKLLVEFEEKIKALPHLSIEVIYDAIIITELERTQAQNLQIKQTQNAELQTAILIHKNQGLVEAMAKAAIQKNSSDQAWSEEYIKIDDNIIYTIKDGIIFYSTYPINSFWQQIKFHFAPTKLIDEVSATTVQTVKNLLINAVAGAILTSMDDACQAGFNERPLAYLATKSVNKYPAYAHTDYFSIKNDKAIQQARQAELHKIINPKAETNNEAETNRNQAKINRNQAKINRNQVAVVMLIPAEESTESVMEVLDDETTSTARTENDVTIKNINE